MHFLLSRLGEEKTGARGIARLLERLVMEPLAAQLLVLGPGEFSRFVLDDQFYDQGVLRCAVPELAGCREGDS